MANLQSNDHPSRTPKRQAPIWAGPYSDRGGITQSLISKFTSCRHRFWLSTVCGAVEDQGLNIPLLYGDAFHNAIEAYALGRLSPEKASDKIKEYFHAVYEKNPKHANKCSYWSNIGCAQFKAYCKHWEKEDRTFESLMEEEVFKIPYTLPSGRKVVLRGKWDGVIRSGEGQNQSVLYFEHKVKGEIDATNLPITLPQNFQVMVYMIPLYLETERRGIPTPTEVLYNVIQRPLAGGRNSISQKKGRKTKNKKTGLIEVVGAETETQFLNRLEKLFYAKPNEFFYRWRASISKDEIDRFRRESLDPLLEQLCDWWDSIKDDPFNPWEVKTSKTSIGYEPYATDGNIYPTFLTEDRKPNPLHYRRPFGIYDKLAKGLVGDYQDYLTTGNKSGLKQVTTVFPELESV